MFNEIKQFLQAHDPSGKWLEAGENVIYNELNLRLYDFENSRRALMYINWLANRIFN